MTPSFSVNVPHVGAGREGGSSIDLAGVEEAPSAMTITGSMNEEGLGLVSWWE